jgi:lipopolysaccharide biosynthesis glycosyltransferase
MADAEQIPQGRCAVKVGFLHVGANIGYAVRMVASVKRAMPDCEIVQMTDQQTPKIEGIDRLVRRHYDVKAACLMRFRMAHLADLSASDWLILDTDIIVRKDVRDAFLPGFDAALTRRDHSIYTPDGQDVGKTLPYNAGVMFCRNPKFWFECGTHVQSLPDQFQRWWGDQMALVAIAPRFKVLELPCATYNYSPTYSDEDLSERAIVHYKGRRKPWMLQLAA